MNELVKKMINIKTETTNRVICPCCNKPDSSVDHLLGTTTETKWYCDSCGQRYSLSFDEDGSLETNPLNQWVLKTLDILKYEDAYIVVEGMVFAEGSKDNFDCERKAYWYNEHTCPTNYLGVKCLYDHKHQDPDPHGMFEYIGYALMPEDYDDLEYDFGALIEELKDV